MRIRSIKPEFYRSDDISILAWEDRLLFIGLWSYVDDNGVGMDRLASITADLFSGDLERDSSETFARVSRGLQTLAEAGRITRYTVDGKKYLHITNWAKHQRIDKPNKERYPLPTCDDAQIVTENATPSRQSRETPAPGTEEQGNRGIKDLSSKQDEFEQWYSHYPRKEAKEAARKAFAKARKQASLEQLIHGVQIYKRVNKDNARQFIALPATWLNAGRWEDETPGAPGSTVDVEAILGKDYWTVPEAPAHMSIAEGLAWKKAQRAAHDQEREQLARKKVETLAA